MRGVPQWAWRKRSVELTPFLEALSATSTADLPLPTTTTWKKKKKEKSWINRCGDMIVIIKRRPHATLFFYQNIGPTTNPLAAGDEFGVGQYSLSDILLVDWY